MNANWECWYRALKEADPETYRSAIEHAEGLSLNYHLNPKVAAEVERAFVMFACSLLGLSPPIPGRPAVEGSTP